MTVSSWMLLSVGFVSTGVLSVLAVLNSYLSADFVIATLAISAPVCVAMMKINVRRMQEMMTYREFKMFREGLDGRLDTMQNDIHQIAKKIGCTPTIL